MVRHLLTSLLCAASLSATTAQTAPSWPEVPQEAKAGSRWWWLGSAVDKENLKWQMEQLAAAGIGTLEITPIYGVKGNTTKNITFLTPEWLDMLRYCREQGERLGIDIDMTTGTGWPSGGPMVKREESASKLATETFDLTADGTTEKTFTLTTGNGLLQCIMAFPMKGTEAEAADLTALADGKTLKWTAPVAGTWKIVAAYCQPGVMQVKRPSPGSEGLVLDYFDKEAVANYLKYFDTKFEAGGEPWPHSFFNDSYEINQADWTRSLLTEFEQRRGYRLQDYFDLLIGLKDVSPTAHPTALTAQQVYSDYRQTLSEMLLENFTRQWTEWAHRHGATTRNQAHGSPGNLIDLYAVADIPETENFYLNSFGIRGLRNDVGFYNKALSSRATLKYASSAAHITGKRLTSSESMTWLTEHFRTSLSQIKPELDLLFTSGVNHVLFHGTAYSPREAAWPGWKFYAAIDMSPTNSIWHDAPAMMKYIERVQSFLQMGQPDNDVLVYAPFANAWRKNTGSYANRLLLFDINTLDSKMSEMKQCVDNLEALGLDCDYTSEQFLMTTTATADGGVQTAAGTRYKAIVVPLSNNLPDSVKTHLDELAEKGVQIVYGRSISDLSPITQPTPNTQHPTPNTLTGEAMRSEMGLSVIRRSNEHGHHYFIANLTPNDAEGYVPLAVSFQSAAFFDPMTGNITVAPVSDAKVWLSLKSGQSVILQTYDSDLQHDAEPVKELAAITIGDAWTLSLDSWTPYQLEKPQTWETLSEQAASFMGTGTYETTFTVNAQQLKTATAGFRLDLGDVRESARVWLNGVDLGCAWAVPFILDCRDNIHEGENKLSIEVTNLPANRIRQMEIDGTEWRIFEDANIANISSATYTGWSLVPSGLSSKVKLIPLAKQSNALTAEMTGMTRRGDFYYPQFKLSAASSLTLKTQDGKDFAAYDILPNDDGTAILTVMGNAHGPIIVETTGSEGKTGFAYVPAYGAYDLQTSIDLTADSAEPLGGWQILTTTSEIKGFSAMGKLPWNRSKANGKSLTLYDGLTFTSESSNYYFYFPGYGMNTTNDFSVTASDAAVGSILSASYLKGTGDDIYNAADSLLTFVLCEDADQPLCLPLTGNKSMTIYRSLCLYTPADATVGIENVSVERDLQSLSTPYYTLQGIQIENRKSGNRKLPRGLYIQGNRKIYIK